MSKLTLSFRGKTLKIFPITQGTMVIGSDPSCQILIDSLAVAPQHARVETHGTDSILFAIDQKEGTFVHQDKITEHKLKDGDLIRIGKHNLSFSFAENLISSDESTTNINIDISAFNEKLSPKPVKSHLDASPATAQTKQGWLQILSGENLGKTLSLHRSMTNLGKPGLATAVITRRNDGYFIAHLEGKVTPVVRNESIGDRSVKLNDGDVIQIGNIKLQFYLE